MIELLFGGLFGRGEGAVLRAAGRLLGQGGLVGLIGIELKDAVVVAIGHGLGGLVL